MNSAEVLKYLQPYKGKKIVVNEGQAVNDIIGEIKKAHIKYAPEYDKICSLFWKGNAEKTAKYVYTFLRNNVKYSIEPTDRQSVKSPAAILATGQYRSAGNDCKHFSLFAAGIFDALCRQGKKINFVYRFVNYRIFETEPQHVFVVVNDRGREIYVDAVLFPFNYKKPFISGIDKKIKLNKMPVYKISGIDNAEADFGQITLEGPRRRGRRSARKQQRAVKKTARKQKRAVKKTARKQRRAERGSVFKRVALAIPRNAFLKLVALNFRNYAYKLNEVLKNPQKRDALTRKWGKLGGKKDILIKNIQKGVQKYKKKNPSYIGEPLTVVILTTAAAIISALAPFIGKKRAEQDVQEGMANATPEQKVEIQEQTKEAVKLAEQVPAGRPTAGGGGGGGFDVENKKEEEQEIPEPSEPAIDKNKLLLIGGIGLAAILLMRKK